MRGVLLPHLHDINEQIGGAISSQATGLQSRFVVELDGEFTLASPPGVFLPWSTAAATKPRDHELLMNKVRHTIVTRLSHDYYT